MRTNQLLKTVLEFLQAFRAYFDNLLHAARAPIVSMFHQMAINKKIRSGHCLAVGHTAAGQYNLFQLGQKSRQPSKTIFKWWCHDHNPSFPKMPYKPARESRLSKLTRSYQWMFRHRRRTRPTKLEDGGWRLRRVHKLLFSRYPLFGVTEACKFVLMHRNEAFVCFLNMFTKGIATCQFTVHSGMHDDKTMQNTFLSDTD